MPNHRGIKKIRKKREHGKIESTKQNRQKNPNISVTQETIKDTSLKKIIEQQKLLVRAGGCEGSDHGAVPLAPLPPSPVRLAAGREHGYLSAGFWFPRK